jgi:ATP-dependent exoDNAse (exonuclease V) beta subunit
VFAATQREIDLLLTRQLQDTRDRLGTPWGHLAVLAERTRSVEHYSQVLTAAGIPSIELTAYDGTSTDRVKIGTIKRSKGLEFPYVLLPGLSQEPPALIDG